MLTELFFVIYLKVYPTFAYMACNIDTNSINKKCAIALTPCIYIEQKIRYYVGTTQFDSADICSLLIQHLTNYHC